MWYFSRAVAPFSSSAIVPLPLSLFILYYFHLPVPFFFVITFSMHHLFHKRHVHTLSLFSFLFLLSKKNCCPLLLHDTILSQKLFLFHLSERPLHSPVESWKLEPNSFQEYFLFFSKYIFFTTPRLIDPCNEELLLLFNQLWIFLTHIFFTFDLFTMNLSLWWNSCYSILFEKKIPHQHWCHL